MCVKARWKKMKPWCDMEVQNSDFGIHQESMTQECPMTVFSILPIGILDFCMGIQRESKNRCGIRGGTLRWKGNLYLIILVSWILIGNGVTCDKCEKTGKNCCVSRKHHQKIVNQKVVSGGRTFNQLVRLEAPKFEVMELVLLCIPLGPLSPH